MKRKRRRRRIIEENANIFAVILLLSVFVVTIYGISQGSISGLIIGAEGNQTENTTSINLSFEENQTSQENETNTTPINDTNSTDSEISLPNETTGTPADNVNATNGTLANETNETTINDTNETTGGPTGGILLPPEAENNTQNASDEGNDNKLILIDVSNTTIIALLDALEGNVIQAPLSGSLNYTPTNFRNGGFERKRSIGVFPNGWFYKHYDGPYDFDRANWTYYPLVAEGHNGTTAIFINITALYEDNARIVSRTLDIEPNTVYNLSFFVKNMKFSKHDFGSIWVMEFNSTLEESGFAGDLVKFNTTNAWVDFMDNVLAVSQGPEDQNGWEEISALFRTSPQGEHIKFALHYSASDESGENYYIVDDVTLEEVD